MISNGKILRILSLVLVLILSIAAFTGCISGCHKDNDINEDDIDNLSIHEENFDILMEELFVDWVTSDSLSLNYFLADPQGRNIERPDISFGEILTPELIEESKQETREIAERLNTFNYFELRYDQQVVYDILRRNIELFMILEREENFNYYTGYVRPLIGFQVQLPVLLAEFNFYTADDIERYLELLGDTKRYFDDIIEFERERSRRGFFLSDVNVDSVCEQIESFLENREDNLLINVFNDRIDNYDGLTNQQRDNFKERNEELVLGNVLVAYETLLNAMQELKGVGVHSGGLAGLPGGEEYAYARLRLRVGTDKSPKELETLYEEWLDNTFMSIMEALYGNPVIFEKFSEGTQGQIPDGTPKVYISDLKQHISKDFPPIGNTGLDVLEVHDSLQDHMSPAFYLAPAIDRFNENVVYINPTKVSENLFMYTVLAHESYPGHMYQTVYFLQQNPHPIRVSLSNSGYSEGWATYSEMCSYYFAIDDSVEAGFMWELRFYDMLIQGYVDLGVNVLGWNFEDVIRFLERFNIHNEEVAQNIYDMVTGIPLNSIMYSVGFIEFMELRAYTEDLMGSDFSLLDFHRFFLDFGSAPFSIIERYLTENIENGQLNSQRPAA